MDVPKHWFHVHISHIPGIYSRLPIVVYQSIGIVNLTAFDVFKELWGEVDAKPAFRDIHGFTAQNRFAETP